ncbi:hypothetical protein INT48_002500 [Thamnidium elegans]|uniref:Uncharacterized protein n=1 Tax=Thamnidium elegans TaxID=101142 RepID=A0A8H7W483_9FUNG|nr:hypothetical protein INT48_002500 [Thamnidium elegans]
MKSTLYLAIFVATLIMMVSAAPSPKKTCQLIKDNHANSVCKKYCGKSGYLLGECGTEGICICKNKKAKKTTKKAIKKTTKKVSKKSSAKKSTVKKNTTKKPTAKKSTASKKQ